MPFQPGVIVEHMIDGENLDQSGASCKRNKLLYVGKEHNGKDRGLRVTSRQHSTGGKQDALAISADQRHEMCRMYVHMFRTRGSDDGRDLESSAVCREKTNSEYVAM